jgi:hypothetical protein
MRYMITGQKGGSFRHKKGGHPAVQKMKSAASGSLLMVNKSRSDQLRGGAESKVEGGGGGGGGGKSVTKGGRGAATTSTGETRRKPATFAAKHAAAVRNITAVKAFNAGSKQFSARDGRGSSPSSDGKRSPRRASGAGRTGMNEANPMSVSIDDSCMGKSGRDLLGQSNRDLLGRRGSTASNGSAGSAVGSAQVELLSTTPRSSAESESIRRVNAQLSNDSCPAGIVGHPDLGTREATGVTRTCLFSRRRVVTHCVPWFHLGL